MTKRMSAKNRDIPTDIHGLLKDTVYIFTDGSSGQTSGHWFGGWAAVLIFNNQHKEISGSKPGATNNEMEAMAILEGIRALKSRDLPVIICSDSQWCVNSINRRVSSKARAADWTTRTGDQVSHRDILQAILDARTPKTRLVWIKGHASTYYNKRADHLAGEARKALVAAVECGEVVIEQPESVVFPNSVEAGRYIMQHEPGGTFCLRSRVDGKEICRMTHDEATRIAADVTERSRALARVIVTPTARVRTRTLVARAS